MFFLNVRVDNLNSEFVLQKIQEFLYDGGQHYIVTVNPDFIVMAQKDKEFRDILNQADLSVADGVGVVWASRLFGEPLQERVSGADIVAQLKKESANQKVFLLGGRGGAAQTIAKNWQNVVDFTENQDEAVNSINRCRPDILLVALGAPKQEKWITQNLAKIPSVKVAMGVGGTFNFLSGKVRRAPEFMQFLGLEWLWRTMTEKGRFGKAWRSVIVFPMIVMKEKLVDSNSRE